MLSRVNKMTVCAAFVFLVPANPLVTQAKSPPARSAVRIITVYKGVVDAKSVDRFLSTMSGKTDKIIGLKIAVERSRDSDSQYYVGRSDGRLVISGGDPMDSPKELVVNGPTGTTMDLFTVDGFYLIKSGGMHAGGALSYGAIPVDEATLRLRNGIRFVERPF